MKALRTLIISAMTGLTLVATGCSVFRGQQSAGSYVDDAAITTAVKPRLAACSSSSMASWGVCMGMDATGIKRSRSSP